MSNKLSIIFLGLCLRTFSVHAATIIAASPSFANVSTAVASAVNGDTVVIPAGTATWNTPLTVNKGITIQGAGATTTVITNGNTTSLGQNAQPLFILDNTGTVTRRITALGMKTTVITNIHDNHAGIGVTCRGYNNLKRVDHCRFDDLAVGVECQNNNGVTDHNAYYNTAFAWRHVGYSGLQQYAWDHYRNYPGHPNFATTNYFFHENETVELTGDAGLSDNVEANSWAIRHCTVTYREAHGPYTAAQSFGGIDCHGDIPPTNQYSTIQTLLYENDLTVKNSAGMDFLKLRGGQALVFNNRVVIQSGGGGNSTVELREERDEYGYSDPPTRAPFQWPHWVDPQYEDSVHNSYVWNNTTDGVVQPPTLVETNISLTIGLNPSVAPSANAWTTAPSPLTLPPYPHALVSEAPHAPERLHVVIP